MSADLLVLLIDSTPMSVSGVLDLCNLTTLCAGAGEELVERSSGQPIPENANLQPFDGSSLRDSEELFSVRES